MGKVDMFNLSWFLVSVIKLRYMYVCDKFSKFRVAQKSATISFLSLQRNKLFGGFQLELHMMHFHCRNWYAHRKGYVQYIVHFQKKSVICI